MKNPRNQSGSYHRVAIAQLSINPAYLDSSGVSYLHEPVFGGEETGGLHRLHDIPEIQDLRGRIAKRYEAHITEKIKAVAEFAAEKRVELLVLPEYSVPASALVLLCYK
jgi:hypothetical protein